MVWGKVKSHPWWPGHIYSEAFASPSVRRSKREGHVLVAFFGDSSYRWFDPAELVPFDSNFSEMLRQTTSRNFVRAVEEAVDEASQRCALGLFCQCRNPYTSRPTTVQGYFALDGGDYKPGMVYSAYQIRKSRDSFQPKEILAFIKQIVLSPTRIERGSIGFIKNKAAVLAYRKAVYEKFDETYAQAFGHEPVHPSHRESNDAVPIRDLMEQSSKQTKCKGKASQITERTVWDPHSTAIFVKLCGTEVLSGRRPQKHLTKEGWENVRIGFERETGRKYTQLQFKNRWDTLKTEWNLWKGLLRGETGLGMNPTTGAIEASDEWWTEKLQRYPDAKMFRYKPLPHADELEIMFVISGATSEDAWAPTSGQLPRCLHDLEDGLLNSDDEIEALDRFTPDEPFATPNSDGGSRKRAGQSGGSTKLKPKKKKVSAASQLNTSLNRIVDSVQSNSESFRGEVEEKFSASKCMAILNSMPELVRNPLYGVAVMAFCERIFRECFINCDPQNRMVLLETRRAYDGKI